MLYVGNLYHCFFWLQSLYHCLAVNLYQKV